MNVFEREDDVVALSPTQSWLQLVNFQLGVFLCKSLSVRKLSVFGLCRWYDLGLLLNGQTATGRLYLLS